jgi:hypothetical protein
MAFESMYSMHHCHCFLHFRSFDGSILAAFDAIRTFGVV